MRITAITFVMLLPWIFGFAVTHVSAAPMNVLFITIDDLRPELSSYKADGIFTPHIDRLAAKGLQFNGAYCQYPVCNPSRASFLTGLRPDELAILSNKVAFRKKWPDVITLPQLFRNNGYFTAGLGKLFHMGTDAEGRKILFRDDASFQYSYKAKGKEPKIGSRGEGRKLGDGTVQWAQWRAAEGGDEAQADGMLAAEAVRLLDENRDKPFFIGVGFHCSGRPFETVGQHDCSPKSPRWAQTICSTRNSVDRLFGFMNTVRRSVTPSDASRQMSCIP